MAYALILLLPGSSYIVETAQHSRGAVSAPFHNSPFSLPQIQFFDLGDTVPSLIGEVA